MDASSDQLAIDGGTPCFPAGPPRWPPPNEAVCRAVDEACRAGAWGKYAGAFRDAADQQCARLAGRQFAWTCCTGTFAVELALRALRIGAGDEVILAGYDFGGNFRAFEAVGAFPVLADIDPRTWSLAADTLEAAIGPQTRAAIVSHLHGGTAPMAEIMELARRRGIAIVEDACQIPGGTVAGKPAGGWGDIGVFSFGGSKLLACGRGGAIVTDDAAVWQRAKIYCDRGNDAFALSELEAAALGPQFDSLDDQNRRRHDAVGQLLAAAPGKLLRPVANASPDDRPSYYKVAFEWRGDATASRERLICAAQAEGIALDEGFRGFARRPASRCRISGSLAHSARAAEATVVLHHPILLGGAEEIRRLAQGLEKLERGLS